ncbi:MAG: MFS transporter [Chloroflexota bacterium]
MRNYAQLLRDNPDYARLWLAQVISLLGDWFNTITLLALVTAYSPENIGLAVSGFLLARFIPPMLISPFAGVLVDRFDRKRLLLWSNWLRAVVVVLLLLTTQGAQWLWLIYALTATQFVLSSVFEPAQSAALPNLVRGDDLVKANTLVNITWSAMLAFGAVIGGVVGTLFGANAALLIDAGTFIFAALLIAPIKADKFVAVAPLVRDAGHNDTSFREGLRFLRRNRPIVGTLLIKFGTSIGNVDTLMTIYATQLFVLGDGGQLSLGIMYSAFGIGAIIGPLILNRFNDGSIPVMRRLVLVGFLLATLGWVVIGSAWSLVVVCLALILRAMGGSANWTYSTVMIQKQVPDSYRGRMFSMDMAFFYLATVLSTLMHGTLVDALGIENIRLIPFATMLISLIPLGVWAYFSRRMEARERRSEMAIPQT